MCHKYLDSQACECSLFERLFYSPLKDERLFSKGDYRFFFMHKFLDFTYKNARNITTKVTISVTNKPFGEL